ncbi:F-actin capping protein alpha subunit [Gymnopus androsaceus JB14]|uniref:F-actin-capping protein subunit alpha n=1 Tax=Gymnopus androsaceus JB14 TaxID=1447944 RepID=A0A6A4HXD5_9AGAR|nr:F-actin capping protein alpha subunit [Gymnopus androsaceus JB14]
MEPTERIQAACDFLLQSPPGEINDVLNDVRNIISDDNLLQEGVVPALRKYNLAQFITVDVPETNHQSIISEAARLPSDSEDGQERWIDPRSKTSFAFDHITLEASDPQPYESNEDSEPFRAALEKASLNYLLAHFHDGVSSVFSQATPNQFILQIVANKYNPTNFWSGRWRSEYIVDLNEHTVKGSMLVNVHYYEQGNVQLSTTHSISLTLPPAIVTTSPESSGTKILALIEAEEGKYQTSLNDTYHEMSEKTFKSLRRALPMTRSKLDWEKVLGYKLGAELSSTKGGFTPS